MVETSPSIWLPKTGFLALASDDLRRLLSTLAREVVLREGEVLFEKGDEGETLYAIASGALEFSVLSKDGRKLSLDVMRSGALFGEIALFDPGARTATVAALEPSRLLEVHYKDVLSAIRDSPSMAVDMIRLAGQRMRWISTQLHEQAFMPVQARLARKVLYLLSQHPEGQTFLPLSQSDLAEFVGSTREAVSKTLAGWKRAGLIKPERGGLRVINQPGLSEIAQMSEI